MIASKRARASLVAVVAGTAAVLVTWGGVASSKPASHARAAAALPANCKTIGGSSSAKYTVVSDLPLQGTSRNQTVEMTKAEAYVFKAHGYKAGKFTFNFSSCDDATAQAGAYTPQLCATNANAYVRDRAVIGEIGTFNSGCAAIEIPINNRAVLGMVSPANSLVGLTQKGKSTAPGEPNKYYPNGHRNYCRVIVADNFQGAADAVLAKSLGIKKVYILDDNTPYGIGVATNFKGAAAADGITIAGFEKWDTTASDFTALMSKIKQSNADAVFLGGIVDLKGDQVIKDKVSVLGANTGAVKLIASDGFAQTSTVTKAGASNAAGMYLSAGTIPGNQLVGAGKKFYTGFSKAEHAKSLQPYTVYAAQAAEVMYNAIAKSNGSRASVTSALLKTNLTGSILGNVKFNANGDTTAAKVTIYIASGNDIKVSKQITPPANLVKAAA